MTMPDRPKIPAYPFSTAAEAVRGKGSMSKDRGFEHIFAWLVWKRERDINCGLMVTFGITLASLCMEPQS